MISLWGSYFNCTDEKTKLTRVKRIAQVYKTKKYKADVEHVAQAQSQDNAEVHTSWAVEIYLNGSDSTVAEFLPHS